MVGVNEIKLLSKGGRRDNIGFLLKEYNYGLWKKFKVFKLCVYVE